MKISRIDPGMNMTSRHLDMRTAAPVLIMFQITILSIFLLNIDKYSTINFKLQYTTVLNHINPSTHRKTTHRISHPPDSAR